jgi:hypothetical protein
MASINNLVSDINSLLRDTSKTIKSELSFEISERKNPKSRLRMSNFGTACDRKIWYEVNHPEKREALLPHTRLKFAYGDLIEQLILQLAKEAGHSVEGAQEELEIEGVIGHRDAIIDGVLVDIKSANARQFTKFKKPIAELERDVWFKSYLDQLDLYLEASQDDPKLLVKKYGAFLAVDKELGHIQLKFMGKSDKDWKSVVIAKKNMVSGKIPERGFNDQADGASGNRALCTYCSYCDFKHSCWGGLRTFVASTGPKHLTVVKREPSLLEIK